MAHIIFTGIENTNESEANLLSNSLNIARLVTTLSNKV
jgi:hypothetical protein